MKRLKSFEVKRIRSGVLSRASVDLIAEQTLTLLVNGRKLLSFQCLPEMQEELAIGFLITEGLAASHKDISDIAYNPEKQQVSVRLGVDARRLREFREALISGSSCGRAISSGAKFDPLDCRRRIDMSFRVEGQTVLRAMAEFRRRAAHADRPRGIHAAAITEGAKILAFAEDVGRHNAVDKVVGLCALRRIILHDKLLLTTGRITLEVAAKALRAGLPLIASTRGPTAAAVELARDAAIAIAAFVTANGLTLCSADWRLASPQVSA